MLRLRVLPDRARERLQRRAQSRARTNVESFHGASGSADYPVGTRRATFGYSLAGRGESGRVLDEEVIVHVVRT